MDSTIKMDLEATEELLSKRSHEVEQLQRDLLSCQSELSIMKKQDQFVPRVDLIKLRRELDSRDERYARLEGDYERLYKRKHDIGELFVHKEEESLKKLTNHLDSIQKEITRYRKERDDMREMYESANAQVASLSKSCTHLQLMIDSLKSKVQSMHGQGEQMTTTTTTTTSLDTDNALLEELSSIEKAYDALLEQNQRLIKECSEKDNAFSGLSGEKMKLEFKSSQALKDAEIRCKNADELEVQCISKYQQFLQREKALIFNNNALEKELSEKNRMADDFKKKVFELNSHVSDVEKNLRHVKGEMEEVNFLFIL